MSLKRFTLSAVSSLLLLLLPDVLMASQRLSPTEVLHIPAGADPDTQVRYELQPDCRYGPQSFRVDANDESIFVLDPLNQAIKVYRGGSLSRSLIAPSSGRDFVMRSEAEYICLAGNQLVQFQDGRPAGPVTAGAALPLIRRIDLTNDRLQVLHHDGTRSDARLPFSSAVAGTAAETGNRTYEAWKRSRRLAEVIVRDGSGEELSRVSLPVPTDNLGCVNFIGADGNGRMFIDVDLVVRVAPLRVQREIWVVSESGDIQGRITVPTHTYSLMFRDMELAADGDLFHMVSSEDGIHIFRWDIPESGVSFQGTYPSPYDTVVHYNFIETTESRDPGFGPTGTLQLVTRSEASSIGDTYVDHVWTCSAQNISNGVVLTADGDSVLTPDWIQIGSNQQVPYKWGGTDILAVFDAGIAAGQYAGDIHTDGSSSYARGVDCSGFVCRCWKTTIDYSTYMMDDPAYGPITLPYTSWEDLQVGDAVHRHGHVRMALGTLPGGEVLVVESAGSSTGWRVGYQTYSYSELTDYSPRYYIHMEGAPTRSTIVSTRSGSWTTGSTWVGGIVPDTTDHVQIQSGHTISIDNNNAVCMNLSFAANDALIDMNSNSTLTIFGDMTLASTSQVAFSAGWSSTNAYLKFAGAAVQTLSGWNTAGGSTSLRDVIIDKSGGKVVTDGTEMRLGIQNSLRIVNGTLELEEGDDIEGRWASSGTFTNTALPTVTIEAGGIFTMVDGDGAHHIRSGVGVAIGKFTVYGEAQFRDGSTYGINFSGMDVESGGGLVVSVGMGDGQFSCGTVVVKSGAKLTNFTTTDPWAATAVLQLDSGGLFESKTATTIFPASFVNNGKVRYSRDAGSDQTVVDMNYRDLEISFDPGTQKRWTLGANRVVSGELEVNNGANLVITAGVARSLTVGSSLRMTSGTIDNSDSDVALTLSDGAMLTRATGTLAAAPSFAGLVDVRYVSTVTTVTTGPELPTGSGVLRDLTVSGTQGVTLGAGVKVNGTCGVTGSDLVTGPHTVTLGPSATLVESAGTTIVGTATTTRTVGQSVTETFGGMGLELTATGAAPGMTTLLRVTGTAKNLAGTEGVERYFDIAPTLNSGLDATVLFHYDESELNGISEAVLEMYALDAGGTPEGLGGTIDASGNMVTVSGIDGLETLTLGPSTLVAVEPGELSQITRLLGAYPNPFSPSTTISFELSRTMPVTVEVFDVTGRKVRTLRDGVLGAARHAVTWTGVNDAGQRVTPGVYFCRLVAGNVVQTTKMSLLN
jgi:hypothetical protein